MSKIANFIAEDNPAAAQRYITRLRERTEVLRAFPESGHRIRKRSNIRALIERPIIIVYAVKMTGLRFCVFGTEDGAIRK
ncbi:MAG: type II toxin-antitoxin system RelE/ParE family toxin [Verrucomicrobia bacterium]|nr:type II toxin-antitoxin system RelE/ParE family toxin [Verrucomicrobiota bacterium]